MKHAKPVEPSKRLRMLRSFREAAAKSADRRNNPIYVLMLGDPVMPLFVEDWQGRVLAAWGTIPQTRQQFEAGLFHQCPFYAEEILAYMARNRLGVGLHHEYFDDRNPF